MFSLRQQQACSWGWMAQRSVCRRFSAALAQVFNVSGWNVLNTTFYKGTFVKHLH